MFPGEREPNVEQRICNVRHALGDSWFQDFCGNIVATEAIISITGMMHYRYESLSVVNEEKKL